MKDQSYHKTYQSILDYYAAKGRHDLPWRTQLDPYLVTVSELMLQQTQVPRVLPKFQQFILRFPDWKSLSEASLSDVLSVWQGLGYNRRAKYLHDMSRSISDNEFPISIASLVTHKGIGSNTAAAILTYSCNQRHVFIETNVRTVLIHHFCPDQQDVNDAQLEHHLLKMLELTDDYRHFYWALMDYGTHLKQQHGNNISRSAHYRKQSRFHGSMRQLRAAILREVLSTPQTIQDLRRTFDDERVDVAIDALKKEGMIIQKDKHLHIA